MALLTYTLLRVLLFAVVAALCWVFGLRGFVLLLVAVLVSGVLSIFVLNRSRDAVSTSLANRLSTIKNRMAERTAAEDAWADAHRADADVADEGRRVPRRQSSTDDDMTEQDRRTKEQPTPGEDPREIDRERTTDQALTEQAAQESLVHRQRRSGGLGTSSDAPGRDLSDLDDSPDVPGNRDQA